MADTLLDLGKDSSALEAMRRLARDEFLEKYDAAGNHRVMLNIYRKAIEDSETVAAT
jgi:hypothetical protein